MLLPGKERYLHILPDGGKITNKFKITISTLISNELCDGVLDLQWNSSPIFVTFRMLFVITNTYTEEILTFNSYSAAAKIEGNFSFVLPFA